MVKCLTIVHSFLFLFFRVWNANSSGGQGWTPYKAHQGHGVGATGSRGAALASGRWAKASWPGVLDLD